MSEVYGIGELNFYIIQIAIGTVSNQFFINNLITKKVAGELKIRELLKITIAFATI